MIDQTIVERVINYDSKSEVNINEIESVGLQIEDYS